VTPQKSPPKSGNNSAFVLKVTLVIVAGLAFFVALLPFFLSAAPVTPTRRPDGGHCAVRLSTECRRMCPASAAASSAATGGWGDQLPLVAPPSLRFPVVVPRSYAHHGMLRSV
jgi:hypothetical protein